MNDVQWLIDRQLGFYNRHNYDNVLKRLVVREEDCFYGLSSAVAEDPPIFACRFAEKSGREHILALANEDGRVAIQDTSKVATGNSLEGFLCHNNAVFDLAWMPGAMNFVTVSGDHTACLWDVDQGAPKKVLSFLSHTRSVKTAVFRPEEPSVFATGARDGHILVWDIRANNQPTIVVKPDNCLMNCHSSFTPKTPGSHTKRPRIDTHRAISITGLVFQDDLTLISCGECDGNIKVWDLRKNYSNYTREPLPKHSIPYCGSSTKNGYTNLIVDDARIRLYASCMDNVIYCFNISTYSALPEQRYVGHENSTFYIKTGLSPDCRYLVSGSSDKHAYIWNVKCSQPVVRLSGHFAEVTCAAWARSQRGGVALVTCSDDARHKLWRLAGHEYTEGEDAARALRGRASPVPRQAASLPPWRADRTPVSLKRRRATPSSASRKRARTADRPGARPTKRCLTDLLNASSSREPTEETSKRAKIDVPSDPPLLAAGSKRAHEDASISWSYSTPAGTSFLSPTKNFEKRTCRILSPRSPRPITAESAARSPIKVSPRSESCARSPVKVSPTKVRVISFGTPTKDLPDFVRTGEAPHLRLMSPVKRRAETDDWLTALSRQKRARPLDSSLIPTASSDPQSPKEPPVKRDLSDRGPKSLKKSSTLLKYFSVASRDKRK